MWARVQAAAGAPTGKALEALDVQNSFTSELPGDPDTSNVPRQVHGALWSPVEPTPVATEPSTIAFSEEVCALLGLDAQECTRPEFPLIFAGNAPLPNGKPYAQVRLFRRRRVQTAGAATSQAGAPAPVFRPFWSAPKGFFAALACAAGRTQSPRALSLSVARHQ